MSRVRVAREGAVYRITLARPEKKNALDRQMADELLRALARAGAEPDVRVVVIDADGPDFCAGADLSALAGMLDADSAAHFDDAMALGRVFTAMRELPLPVVAIVRGRALAGGTGLATAADIVLASEDAQFGYPEVRVGFVPAMVMTMLRRAVGEKVAFDLVASARRISAGEARSIGLVSRVLPAAEFDAAARAAVEEMAVAPASAMRLTKRLFYELDGRSFADGIEAGARVNAEARSTPDFRDGVLRFTRRQ